MSFGGPIAHLGYFHEEYVIKRKWIDEQSYGDIVSFAQSLPGAASSKTGIMVGTHRAGVFGGIAAWIGFTLPTAVALTIFGFIVESLNVANAGWLEGLKIAAVVIVAQAVWNMGKNLAPDRLRGTIAIGAAIAALAFENFAEGQVVIIAASGLIGWFLLRNIPIKEVRVSLAERIPRWLSISSLVAFFGLIIGLPIAREFISNHALDLFDSFYRTGALVFGGGHVVLPLLNTEVVQPGWVSSSNFLAGYGMTQAMPGPLFAFCAFLGVVMNQAPNGVEGAFLCLFAIFLPSFLLVYGPLPYWDTLRQKQNFQSVLRGINAGVVGILLAALYNPIFTSSIFNTADFALLLGLGGMLFILKRPPWNVVLVAAVVGEIISLVH